MEALILAAKNHEELLEAERLGTKAPKMEEVGLEFVFLLGTVAWAYKLHSGHIRAQIAGKEIVLLPNEEIWQRLKLYLNQQG